MKTKLVAGACVALSGVCGFATASPPPTTLGHPHSKPIQPAAAAPTAARELLCGSGTQNAISVDFDNLRSRAGATGNPLSTDIIVRCAFGQSARVSYAIEWLDDHGRHVRDAEIAPVARVAPGASLRVTRETPSDLPDGFYELHVRAMGIDDSGVSTAAENRSYVQIKAGDVIPLGSDEWYELSNANGGVTP
jgi:hypothetical protein